MNHSGLTRRLINFFILQVRPLGGGLGEVNVVSSMIFGGISGSSVADTSALGSILIPDMVKQGYPKKFAAGITVASSTIGMIIPPSVPMLMYSMVSGASVGVTQLVLTPPVGMCLNVASKICNLEIIEIFKAALPFIICNIIVLLMITFIPELSMWLPSFIG